MDHCCDLLSWWSTHVGIKYVYIYIYIYLFSHAMFFTHPASERCVTSHVQEHQQRPILDTCWMHDWLRSSSLQGGEFIRPISRVISPSCQAFRRFMGGFATLLLNPPCILIIWIICIIRNWKWFLDIIILPLIHLDKNLEHAQTHFYEAAGVACCSSNMNPKIYGPPETHRYSTCQVTPGPKSKLEKLIFQWPCIFRCYVSFREDMCSVFTH